MDGKRVSILFVQANLALPIDADFDAMVKTEYRVK
jgi:hypothetical protein